MPSRVAGRRCWISSRAASWRAPKRGWGAAGRRSSRSVTSATSLCQSSVAGPLVRRRPDRIRLLRRPPHVRHPLGRRPAGAGLRQAGVRAGQDRERAVRRAPGQTCQGPRRPRATPVSSRPRSKGRPHDVAEPAPAVLLHPLHGVESSRASPPPRAPYQNVRTSRPRTPPAASSRCASAACSAGNVLATRRVIRPSSTCCRSRSSLARSRV